jgi:hypothetical protein
MSLPHLQNPATPDTDTPTPYRQPGVMRVLARELGAAIDRADYAYAESVRFALNAIAESTPVSAPTPAPVRPGYITGAWPMTPAETNERMRSYFATVNPAASGAEAEAHAARCGLVVVR